MTATMSAVDQLLICQELTRLKGVFCRTVDAKDWDGFAALFAPDATLDFQGSQTTSVFTKVLQGPAEIVDTIRRAIGDGITAHQCHTPEFEVLSPTEARVIWHQADHLRWPEGSPVLAKDGCAYYYETYVLLDGEWKIKTSRLQRVLSDVTRAPQ